MGIIMYELLTENTSPYGKVLNIELQVCQNPQFRPKIPVVTEESMVRYVDIMQTCWAHSPSERPSSEELVTSLEQCYSMLYSN